ncbi:MAG: PASTA domain-containing protein, partial [Bacteroidales bacterium]|nr:PASTA domain-containing protein [Bacteroidales bacterium]
MNFFRFLVSKLFIKNLLYAILIGIGLIIFALQVLKVYTRHGQAKLVPNLTGISVSEVQKICKKKGLRYQITDSVYLSNKPKGTVIEQNPSPNFRVKKNRTIFLIINAFNPELVKMPNVKGVSFRQAKAIIEAKGLKVGKIEYVRDIAINNVLGVKFQGGDLKTNTEIPKYSKIDFVLGNG